MYVLVYVYSCLRQVHTFQSGLTVYAVLWYRAYPANEQTAYMDA